MKKMSKKQVTWGLTSNNPTTGQMILLGDRGWARLVHGGKVLPTAPGHGMEFVTRGAGMEEVFRGGSGPTVAVTSRVVGARSWFTVPGRTETVIVSSSESLGSEESVPAATKHGA